jgi:hypothetical protein
MQIPLDKLFKMAITKSNKFLQEPQGFPMPQHGFMPSTRELALVVLQQHTWLV